MEEEAGTDDLGVVAHEYGALGQETGQVTEGKFFDLTSLVAEELGAAAVGKGVLGDALVGQRVVVVGYLDLLGSYIHLTLLGGNIPDVGGTKVRKSVPSASAPHGRPDCRGADSGNT